MHVLGGIGADHAKVLDLLAHVDARRLPLDDDVAWQGDLGLDLGGLVEDDATLGLGVRQPALDDDVLGLGGQRGQSFDDDLAWWWWQAFARDGDALGADWRWGLWRCLADHQGFGRFGASGGLADDEWWGRASSVVWLLGDDDFAGGWWSENK